MEKKSYVEGMGRSKSKSQKGESAFHEFFSRIYGERWERLFLALKNDRGKVALLNPFHESGQRGLAESFAHWTLISRRPQAFDPGVRSRIREKLGQNGLLDYYFLDEASLLAAKTLQVQPYERVLDMCAAPGGKALAMIFTLHQAEAKWTLNDLSQNRVKRLHSVIKDYVPRSIANERIRVTRFDASRWGMAEPEAYSAVLLDAPCSGEHYLLQKRNQLAQWSVKQSQSLARRQYALLCAGIDALEPGGRLLYSTCSISPLENDGVIQKYLKKKQSLKVLPVEWDIGEATEFGWQVLPDRFASGPIYFSLLQKVPMEK